MNKLSIVLIALIVTSCASVKPVHRPKTYSSDTHKSFAEIERAKAIENYRKMRELNWDDYTKEAGPLTYRKKYSPVKRKPIIKKPTVRRPVITQDPKEQQIEVKQNLSYFCMAKRKDYRFSQDGSCNQFTQNILESCKKKFVWGEKGLLRCVKSQLR